MRLQAYPAYGRVFKTLDALKQSWEKGQDFQLSTVNQSILGCGTYINKSDFEKYSAKLGVEAIDLKCNSLMVSVEVAK